MTFQVGIATADGVLLASDRKIVESNFRFALQTSKIVVREDLGFAHCSAGDCFCDTFTSEIVRAMEIYPAQFTDIDSIKVFGVIVDCIDRARAKESEWKSKQGRFANQSPGAVGGNTMLIFRGERGVALWTVRTDRPDPSPQIVEGVPKQFVMAGDPSSNAVFWLHHYFENLPSDLDALTPLAAHAVLMAKNENIEGLQIGVFSQKRFGRLTDQELKTLVALSDEIDSDILRRLKR